MKKILVISPHPDDESIGCGGTLYKHSIEGDIVHVIFLTSGEKGNYKGQSKKEIISIRENETKAAVKILGIKNIEFWRCPDGRLKADHTLIQKLLKTIKKIGPDIIYVTHNNEQHVDHVEAATLVKRSVNKLRDKPKIFMYEVWTPIQKMDLIIDISKYIKTKIKAIKAYKSQCDVVKYYDAALALNRYRGEMHSWPDGGDYAEVFEEMRFK